jgi:hypothetical protein
MITKLETYGYKDPKECIESNIANNAFQFYEKGLVEVEEFKENEELDESMDIQLYDMSLTSEQNFQNGEKTKYILLPINSEGIEKGPSFTPLLNAGGKIILNKEKAQQNMDYIGDTFVVDYDSMFGVRLLSFQKYNSDFFSCDERVFFETLIIKYHRFGFKSFFLSYNVILKELGIKKDRMISIKFQNLAFLKTEIITKLIEGRPSQVTYYTLDANKIVELLPLIYIADHLEVIDKDIKKYLEPALKKVDIPKDNESFDITSIMQ